MTRNRGFVTRVSLVLSIDFGCQSRSLSSLISSVSWANAHEAQTSDSNSADRNSIRFFIMIPSTKRDLLNFCKMALRPAFIQETSFTISLMNQPILFPIKDLPFEKEKP